MKNFNYKERRQTLTDSYVANLSGMPMKEWKDDKYFPLFIKAKREYIKLHRELKKVKQN